MGLYTGTHLSWTLEPKASTLQSRAGVLSVSFLEMRSMLILEECKIHRHQEKEKQNDDVVSGNGGPEADFLGPSTLILVRELQ